MMELGSAETAPSGGTVLSGGPVRPLAPDVALVPGGAFRMGSADGRSDETPVHDVRVSPFFMARTPVTVAEYGRFFDDGSAHAPAAWQQPGFSDPRQPVVGITWFDAVAYAEWLSESGGGGWRLPTEAQWERAARSGALPGGEIPRGPLAGPWPVGLGRPNGYGLLDMGTIVHEWCLDWYKADYYLVSPVENPRGPEEGDRRASRGGSWRHHVRWSPPAARSSLPPGFRYTDYGFRVVREIPS